MKTLLKVISPFVVGASIITPMSMTSCSKISYSKPEKVFDYLHEITYDDYRYDSDYETIDDAEAFGCSSVRVGNYYGRNFDYVYNDTPEFVVRVKANAKKKRHESIGIATHFGLREDKLLKGKYKKELELIPNFTLDGINDAGVICSTNVVSMEPNGESGVQVAETSPGSKEALDLHVLFIPRFVLDNANSAQEAVALLSDTEKINITGNLKGEKDIHVMVADQKETYIIEFFRRNGSTHNHFDVVAEQKSYDPKEIDVNPENISIMTNHYRNMDQANFENDDKYGDERFEILRAYFPNTEEKQKSFKMEDMKELMKKVRYSLAYQKNKPQAGEPMPEPSGKPLQNVEDYEWCSEVAGQQFIDEQGRIQPHGKEWEGFVDQLEKLKDEYANKDRKDADPRFWHTTHNSTYEWDWENKVGKLWICVQENFMFNKEFQINFKEPK